MRDKTSHEDAEPVARPNERVKQRPVPGDRLWDKDLRRLYGDDFVHTRADGTKVTIDELEAAGDTPPKRDPWRARLHVAVTRLTDSFSRAR